MPMGEAIDLDELERLVELVNNASIRELTLKQNGKRVTIRRTVSWSPATGSALAPITGTFTEDEPVRGDRAEAPAARPAAPEPLLESVTAPLVGVFRHVKPMIGLGARVNAGQ